jgi:signal transduction histidine kinase/CHASE2 domain-containing sensor protein
MIWRFGKVDWRRELGWRILPGSLVAAGFAGLFKLSALLPLEHAAYHLLFQTRGEVDWDDRLVLVAIDDASIRQLGRFPWPRQSFVKLLDVLNPADPSVIAIDLIWSESSPDDAALADRMAQSGRVVLATAQDQLGQKMLPVPSLKASAIATGHILHIPDPDGITRNIALLSQKEPAFGLSVARAYGLVQAPVPVPPLQQPLWIHWPGSGERLPQYSFVDVIQGKVPPQRFQNKIVLVGVTATGIDEMRTPFDRNPPASGVQLHAAVLHTLLRQNALRPIALGDALDWKLSLLLLLGGTAFGSLIWGRREQLQVLLWLMACSGWLLLVLVLFSRGIWLPVLWPLCLLTMTTLAVELAERLRTNMLLQRQIQQLWQQHQVDLVMLPPRQLPLVAPMFAGNWSRPHAQLAALAEQFGRSQSTQAAIARSLSIGLLAVDWEGYVWFCNPLAAQWLQVQVGDRLADRLVPQWLQAEQWQADLAVLRHQRSVSVREVHQIDRWFELKLEPLSDASPGSEPALRGLLVLLEDISVRKHAEAMLEQQIQELQRLSQMKNDFLSTVSHELRAPLTNIRLAIELLETSESSEESAYYLSILNHECQRETDLINDLLDLQRMDAGVNPMDWRPISLQTWLSTLMEPFYQQAQAQQQQLQVEIAPDLPPIVSDQHSLGRVLVELVNNACKYTPMSETIAVVVSHRPPQVVFAVTNTGVEIPAHEIPRIFDRFYRIPQADPWKRGGTGLGLALVQKLVTQLGGTIQVQSGAGQTCFTVVLPLMPAVASS